MKAPYFELNKDEDFDFVADNILNNDTALHFTRRRNIMSKGSTIGIVVDSEARFWFDAERESGLKRFNNSLKDFAGWLIAPIAFLIIFSVIIYHLIVGTFAKPDNDVGVMILTFVICFILFGICILSLIHYIRTYRFLKKSFTKMDDLYVIYDNDKIPCCVCIRGKTVKALYKNTVYTVKNEKIKSTGKDSYLYRAYLNMLPWAVLDLDRFYPNERYHRTGRESFEPVITNTYIITQANKYCISLNNTVFHSYQRSTHADTNKPLQFVKYLFEFDNDFQIQTVYSAANESFRFGLEYITKADISEKGEAAIRNLKNTICNNNALKLLLSDTIKISL